MSSLNLLHSESNSKLKINFAGGDLSSDSGLLLIKEFAHKLGFHKLVKKMFKTNDTVSRIHKDDENLSQMIYQVLAGYFNDNDADELTNEPVFKSILDKPHLASQPTLSRFFNRMDTDTLHQLNKILKELRSGFATPDLFKQCETHGVSYAIRLKANQNLYKLANHADDLLDELTAKNKVDYAVVYDEFFYQAASWDYPRRVVVKVEKPVNQLTYQHAFIVTNMELTPEELLAFYCNRGTMENFIKECKNGFDFASASSRSKVVNANRLQLHVLSYNLFNWFRRLVLPVHMRKMRIDTLHLKLIKIASKVIRSARYITFKLCSSCPYKKEFYETYENIRQLPKLE